MISLTIDVRGATPDQLKRFGEIAGMREALHELLYRSRGHADTNITVLGGRTHSDVNQDADFLSIIANKQLLQAEMPAPQSLAECCHDCGC